MNPGYLRKRVSILHPVKTRAANGEQLTSMEVVATRWGSMKAEAGAEGQVAGVQVQATQQWTVRLRYETALSGIIPDWELTIDGRTLRVLTVEDVLGMNRELVIKVAEVPRGTVTELVGD